MATVKADVLIQDSVYEQVTAIADEMQVSPSELFAIAIADYLRRYQNQKLLQSTNEAYADGLDSSEQAMLEGMRRHQRYLAEQVVIRQGDIYWVDLGQPIGSEPAYLRPYVVIQNDVLNCSQIKPAIVCALTTNLRRARAMGNVLLEAGEAGLPEHALAPLSSPAIASDLR